MSSVAGRETSARRQRSEQAQQYRRLYKLGAWKRRRGVQLVTCPLCQWCEAEGRTVAATEVHHVTPHRGNVTAFLEGELVSLCKRCHDSRAQSVERRGYDTAIGVDGWPVDERHPANR